MTKHPRRGPDPTTVTRDEVPALRTRIPATTTRRGEVAIRITPETSGLAQEFSRLARICDQIAADLGPRR